MVEDFAAEVTYLESLKKERCMNDNHVFHSNNFHSNDLQEEKDIQLHCAHNRLSSENVSRDTTFKPQKPN